MSDNNEIEVYIAFGGAGLAGGIGNQWVVPIGRWRFRLAENPVFECNFSMGDVLELEPLPEGEYAGGFDRDRCYKFVRVVERSPLIRSTHVVSTSSITYGDWDAFNRAIVAAGGLSERVMGGVLILNMPPHARSDFDLAWAMLGESAVAREQELLTALRRDVTFLAEKVGERHLGRPDRLARAADWLAQGLAIARAMAATRPSRTVRFVVFVNEEPPYYHTEEMGSLVYARACKGRGETIVGMLALESLGFYTDEPQSQTYPDPALSAKFGDQGNFVALVANEASTPLLELVRRAFRHASDPRLVRHLVGDGRGASWSDHWSFWKVGYPAVMATDTASFRNPVIHSVGFAGLAACDYMPFAKCKFCVAAFSGKKVHTAEGFDVCQKCNTARTPARPPLRASILVALTMTSCPGRL